MFLRAKTRYKDGKAHRYWSIVENRRTMGGRVAQRQVMYLGEINDSQHAAWCKTIEVFAEDKGGVRQVALFPEDRPAPLLSCGVVHIKLDELKLRRPRQWGACWLACTLWDQLKLDDYWAAKLPPSREQTRWLDVFKILVCYRLIDPGSEWRLHRQWYQRSAMADVLGLEAQTIGSDTLYRCLDKLLPHKEGMFSFLTQRWQDMFGVSFDILLYDLTSTYFECDPPDEGKRRFGYSRDKRSDCVQVVIALIVTPQGFPLAYEVLSGNTSDKTTLKDFLQKIERQYGRANRTWVMDRGVPTEEVLAEMRAASTPVYYLVGAPRARLHRLERALLQQSWEQVRNNVRVKLHRDESELYVLACSDARQHKERAMRQRRLKAFWRRLHALQQQHLTRDQLLLKLGAAKKEAGQAAALVIIILPAQDQAVTPQTFRFALNKNKLRTARQREGRYLLRSNLTSEDPAQLWQFYLQLTEVEQAFKELKNDLAVRPIHHQLEHRIEAHIFVAFVAYCLQVTLKHNLRRSAPGLTPRAVLETFASLQMVDVHLPTTDAKELVLSRYTEPEPEHQILLQHMQLTLPPQPPPKIHAITESISAPTLSL